MERLASHFPRYAAFGMAKPSKLKLRPLPHSAETPGQRLVRIRQERGFTQFELAEKTERGKLRLTAGMILRFATALKVSTDALLQPASRKVLRRLEQIEVVLRP